MKVIKYDFSVSEQHKSSPTRLKKEPKIPLHQEGKNTKFYKMKVTTLHFSDHTAIKKLPSIIQKVS